MGQCRHRRREVEAKKEDPEGTIEQDSTEFEIGYYVDGEGEGADASLGIE